MDKRESQSPVENSTYVNGKNINAQVRPYKRYVTVTVDHTFVQQGIFFWLAKLSNHTTHLNNNNNSSRFVRSQILRMRIGLNLRRRNSHVIRNCHRAAVAYVICTLCGPLQLRAHENRSLNKKKTYYVSLNITSVNRLEFVQIFRRENNKKEN